MKRIFLVLALALILVFGNWGQALAAEIVIDDGGEDHPWGGTSNNGDEPQLRNAFPNIGVLYCSIFFIDVILTDRFILNDLNNDTITDAKADDRYLEVTGRSSQSSTSQTRLR